MQNFKLKSFDETELYCYLWDDVENPKGVVMIVHGMGEHAGRYSHFAKFLNEHGYIAFGDDHRGHGLTETDKDRGHHDGDMFADTVRDEVFILKYLEDKYNLPVLMLGHSYGSFLGQSFLEQGTDIVGVALTGTGTMSKGTLKAGMRACKFFMLFNKKMRTAFLNPISDIRDKFLFREKEDKGGKLWLTRDPSFRKMSHDDPLTSVPMSVSFCYYMLKGLRDAETKEGFGKLKADTPIGLFCGSRDTIGGMGKTSLDLKNRYIFAGVKFVEYKLYDGARHEVLNEINRDEVMNDILKFYDYCLSRKTIISNYENGK